MARRVSPEQVLPEQEQESPPGRRVLERELQPEQEREPLVQASEPGQELGQWLSRW